ncbi:MAG: hypothetical protein CL739_04005 [Chloroflexi bacterium]|nr:hypothetical protein [Chloroflexota bacterium]
MGKLPILFFKLLLDRRIPLKYKLLPALGVAYVILPFDIIPDMFPVFGVIDDILILTASVILFMIFGPIQKLTTSFKDTNVHQKQSDSENIVEGEYRIIEQNDANGTR